MDSGAQVTVIPAHLAPPSAYTKATWKAAGLMLEGPLPIATVTVGVGDVTTNEGPGEGRLEGSFVGTGQPTAQAAPVAGDNGLHTTYRDPWAGRRHHSNRRNGEAE